MPVLRRLAASVSESALPGTTRPADFGPVAARAGGPLTLDWHAVFIDAAGRPMAGGSVTVQWYAIEIAADGSVLTPTAGAAVSVGVLQIKRKGFGTGLYPWCTVVASPPSVNPKMIVVTIGGDDDGDYSIHVVGDDEPLVYPASGDSEDDIRDGLIALFAGHPTLTAHIYGDGALYLTAAGGVDFEINLDSPGDVMTEEETAPYVPGAMYVEIHTTSSAAQEVNDDAIQAASEAGAAAALAAANLDYQSVYSADLAAIQYQVLQGTIPSDADVAAAVPPALQKYGGQFGDAATENEIIAAPTPGNRIAIYGWIATRDGDAIQLELRSGVIGANVALTGAPAKFTVGGGSAINLTPGMQPLWHGLPDEKIVLQRSAGSKPFHFAVWYRTVPPA